MKSGGGGGVKSGGGGVWCMKHQYGQFAGFRVGLAKKRE